MFRCLNGMVSYSPVCSLSWSQFYCMDSEATLDRALQEERAVSAERQATYTLLF